MTIEIIQAQRPGLGIGPVSVIAEDTHISRWVRESGRLDHDQSVLPRICGLLRAGAVAIDGGAFIGDHAAAYAVTGAEVWAFEPNPEAYQCLERNLAGYSNVVACQLALGDRHNLEVELVVDPNSGASHVRTRAEGSAVGASVTTVPLDALPLKPQLIKLDIEGFEVRALRGARRMIAQSSPILVLEVNRGALARAGTSAEELHALVSEMGYSGIDLFTESLWEPSDPRLQFDVVCRRGAV